jgi:hypothetical protein
VLFASRLSSRDATSGLRGAGAGAGALVVLPEPDAAGGVSGRVTTPLRGAGPGGG